MLEYCGVEPSHVVSASAAGRDGDGEGKHCEGGGELHVERGTLRLERAMEKRTMSDEDE